MLYAISMALIAHFSFFNVLRYITFRTMGATMTAFLLVLLFGPSLIALLKIKQGKGQPIRTDGPERHLLEKQGTPTMGGLMILFGVTTSTLLWGDLQNAHLWVVLLVTLGFGAVGFYDDYLKVTRAKCGGVRGRWRLCLETMIAIAVGWFCVHMATKPEDLHLFIPFLKGVSIPLGLLFFPFLVCVIVGTANAVNLTDGLDGLAIVPVMIAAASFGLISYVVGSVAFSEYLQIPYVPGTGELAVLCGALIGAGLGILWFNAPPAMIFMGDTGSLALGGALGAIAVLVKHEIVLAIIGGVFVLETVSVIVQVVSFKLTGRRIFAMAPLHHHFEQKGWPEPTIVIRFWIIAVLLALIGLSTLKLR